MEFKFFKEGDYVAQGGFFVRSDLKNFLKLLVDKGYKPVGVKIDLESFNLEVFVENHNTEAMQFLADQAKELDLGYDPTKIVN